MLHSLHQTPAGMIAEWPAATVPDGWLECTGQAVSRPTYANLFDVIGTTFGVGDGSTTFNVPDMRGRTPIGVGTGSGLTARSLAATGGAETHTLSEAELASHNHTFDGRVSDSGVGDYDTFILARGGNQQALGASVTGNDTAHNNMQPWIALKFIIKT